LASLVLWLALIALYFSEIDGAFARVQCGPKGDAIAYCSNEFVLATDCAPTGQNCSVDRFVTVPVLIYLTLAQASRLVIKDISAMTRRYPNGARDWGDRVVLLIFIAAINSFLVVVFVLEAFALPFGEKEGTVAFVLFRGDGLNITALVAAAAQVLLALGLGLSCGAESAVLLWVLAGAALGVHSIVAAALHWAQNARFVSASLFFLGPERAFLPYRLLRTAYSVALLGESVALFSLGNLASRVSQEDSVFLGRAGEGSLVEYLLVGPVLGAAMFFSRRKQSKAAATQSLRGSEASAKEALLVNA
jgi:hypothetical protein